MFPLLLLFSQDGNTPLYIASQKGHTGVVELLLQHNADPNISDKVSQSLMRLHVHVSITQCITCPKIVMQTAVMQESA